MDAFTLVARLTLNRDEFETGMAQIEGDLKTDKFTSPFGAWGVTVGNLASQAFTRVFRAGVNFAKSMLTTGMNFDEMMSSVKAVANLGEKDFEKVRQRAIDLGASTKFTAEEVGEAFYYMGLAGWDTEEMLSGIEGVLNLAAASGEDLGRVSDIVTDAITAMGLSAEDTARFVNVLAAASTNSNTTVGMMGEAFKYLATTGGVLEYSIEDVATVLGLLANNGIKASQAGTSMRQILNTLIAPSDKAANAMEALGLSLFEVGTDKRKPLMQVVQELRQIFADADFDLGGKPMEQVQEQIDNLNKWYDEQKKILDERKATKKEYKDLDKEYESSLQAVAHFNEDFLSKLSDIGGLRGISSLFALMKSNDDDVNQLVEAVGKSSEGRGSAAEMAATMLDNLKGDVTLLTSAVDGLKVALFDEIKSDTRDYVQMVTEGITGLTNLIKHGQWEWTAEDEQNEAINQATADAAEAQGLVSYMDDLIGKYGEAATGSSEWVTAMERLKELIPDITTAIKSEGEELSTTTANFREYIEQHKQKAIQDARNAYVADLQSSYDSAQIELGKAEINAEIYRYQQQEAARALAEGYLAQREQYLADFGALPSAFNDAFADYGSVEEMMQAIQSGEATFEDLSSVAENYARAFVGYGEELGNSQGQVKTLIESYKDAEAKQKSNTDQIATLTTTVGSLETQLQIAEAAAQRMAEKMAAYEVPGVTDPAEHAAGNWFVPYNDYPALLHRGEAVLTASQARQFRENASGANIDISALTSAIVGAVQEGLRDAQVNAYLDGNRVTREVSRIMNDQMMLAR